VSRLFFAVELAEPVREAADSVAREVRSRLASAGGLDARWVPRDNLHITLWFLGDVPQPPLQAFGAPLSVAPFEVGVRGVGVFPSSGPPRVLWMGVSPGAAELAEAHALLTARLVPLGFTAERRAFHPHLTLARVRTAPRRDVAAALRQIAHGPAPSAGRCLVDAIALFRSRLSPRGASYERVLRVPLGT
jgi:RNA 2',3'-cyclic 3'-phosphodiesterase